MKQPFALKSLCFLVSLVLLGSMFPLTGFASDITEDSSYSKAEEGILDGASAGSRVTVSNGELVVNSGASDASSDSTTSLSKDTSSQSGNIPTTDVVNSTITLLALISLGSVCLVLLVSVLEHKFRK